MKSALITGITGQDGSYLAELLLSKGYTVHGLIRRSSQFSTGRIEHLYLDPMENPEAPLRLHYGDLTDGTGLRRVLEVAQPDEVYNLGAQSHVKVSFSQPEYTADAVGLGTLRLLEAIRDHCAVSHRAIRMYQAGSSEMFGAAKPPQSEQTPFHPRSPYAVSKVAAHWYCVNYRESYNLFISNGMLFNHESPRRGETFVTRKITRALARIKLGLQDTLFLGNLDAKRDWGFAGDYVEAMWLMLQHDTPDDFVVATGESYSVRDFLNIAGEMLGLDWNKFVKVDPRYFRPAEVDHLQGDPSKVMKALNWKPRHSFRDLVQLMINSDLQLARNEQTLRAAGQNHTRYADVA